MKWRGGRSKTQLNQPAQRKSTLKAALCHPDALELISKAVAAQVTDRLGKEISGLKEKIVATDREILLLKEQIDSLEQCSRRNCIQTGPVPETATEGTDVIVKAVAKNIGVSLPKDAIGRIHRVGKVTSGTTGERLTLVKFTSYKHKEALLKTKRHLNQIDTASSFPTLNGFPCLPQTQQQAPPTARHFLSAGSTSTKI